jgi:hypothetical protein
MQLHCQKFFLEFALSFPNLTKIYSEFLDLLMRTGKKGDKAKITGEYSQIFLWEHAKIGNKVAKFDVDARLNYW